MLVSIIIVNYNTKELLAQTLNSVFASEAPFCYEIIVADNGSIDGSIDMIKGNYPNVLLIENNANLGFSKANNIAINRSKGEYILLLNSDTILEKFCLIKCVHYLESNISIGALGCKVLLENGTLDLACRRSFPTPEVAFYRMLGISKLFPQNKKFGRYNLTYLDEDEISEVDCIVGAFMFVRKSAINEVGLLDENYFMYGEDVDWCYRIKKAGWKIVYFPNAEIMHVKGASGGKKNPRIIYEFHRAMLVFYRKHYQTEYSWWITVMVIFGIYLKMGVSLLLNLAKVKRRTDKIDKKSSTIS